jgi:hypothetical protein
MKGKIIMINDPIIEELYQIRQKLMDESKGDIKLLMKRLKAAEFQDKDKLVFKTEVKSLKKQKHQACSSITQRKSNQ